MSTVLAATVLSLLAATRPSGSMIVTAHNVPYIRSAVATESRQVQVTDADIRAGYIDVEGLTIDVRTNDPRGYALLIRLSGPFDSAELTGLTRQVDVGPAGALSMQPTPLGYAAKLHVRARLRLAENVNVGSYAFPLSVKVCSAGRTP